MIIDELRRNPDLSIYPVGNCVIVSGNRIALYHLDQPKKLYHLNEDGYKIFKIIDNGCTYSRLKDQLGIKTEQSENSLLIFLNDLIEKTFLTLNLNHRGRLAEKHLKNKPALTRVFLETTQICNLRCQHCYVGELEKEKIDQELTESEILKIIDEANKLGVPQFDFTGGELFAKKGILNILQATADASMYTNIFTNGTLIDEKLSVFLKKLGNIDTIYVSLDDMDEATHDNFRGVKGSYKSTVEAIKLLKKQDLNVMINLVINRRNHLKINEIIEYFKNELDVTCRVAPILYVGRGKCMDEEQLSLKEITDAVIRWYEVNDITIPFDKLNNIVPKRGTDCGVGDNMFFIKSDGEICLCPTLSSEESVEFELGNTRKDSLKEIWDCSEKLKKFRNLTCKESNCSFISLCKEGCRSRAYLMTDDIRGVDPVPCHFYNQVSKALPRVERG